MKTVLVYNAPDIFARDRIVNQLHDNDINTYGADSSINILYPQTPNLYLGGASALIDGYRIFVEEINEERAKKIIKELLSTLNNQSPDFSNAQKTDISDFDASISNKVELYLRRFYLISLSALFIPILPLIFGLFFLFQIPLKSIPISRFKFIFALILYSINLAISYYFILTLGQSLVV